MIGAKHRQVGRSELTIFSEKEKNPKSWPKMGRISQFFWCPKCAINLHWRCLHLSLHGGWTLADTDTPRKGGHIQPFFFVFDRCFCFKISWGSRWNPSTFFFWVNEVIYFETKKNTQKSCNTPPPKKKTWVFQAATFHSSSMLARPNKKIYAQLRTRGLIPTLHPLPSRPKPLWN